MADPTRTNFANGNSTLGSVTVSFGFTATAGRLLVLSVISETTMSTPSGWTLPTGGNQVGGYGHYFICKIASGGETSVTLTMGVAARTVWTLAEFDSVDTSSPVDVSAGQFSDSSAGSYTTPTLTPTSGRRFVVAAMASARNDEFQYGMGSWTNSYTEQTDSVYTVTGSFGGVVALATLAMDGTGAAPTSTGATFDGGVNAQGRYSTIVAFKVAGATASVKRLSMLGVG